MDEVLCWLGGYTGQSVILVRMLYCLERYAGRSIMLDGVLYRSECYLAWSEHCHNRAGPHNVPTPNQKAKETKDYGNQASRDILKWPQLISQTESEAPPTDRNSHLYASLPNDTLHVCNKCTSQRLLIGHRITKTSNIVFRDPNSRVGANTASTSAPPNGSSDAPRSRT